MQLELLGGMRASRQDLLLECVVGIYLIGLDAVQAKADGLHPATQEDADELRVLIRLGVQMLQTDDGSTLGSMLGVPSPRVQ